MSSLEERKKRKKALEDAQAKYNAAADEAQSEEEDDGESDGRGGFSLLQGNSSKIIQAVLVCIIVGGAFIGLYKDDEPKKEEVNPPVSVEEPGYVTPPNKTQEPEPQPEPVKPVGEDLTEPVDSFEDKLSESPSSPLWDMKSVALVKDFANYEKKRSVIANGIELYWLDVNYRDYDYVIQVNFETYLLLETKGIIPVLVEKVTTTEDDTVVTHLDVDLDYLKKMNA